MLEKIWRERRGPRAALKALRRRLPEWLAAAPDMPQLVHEYLTLATRGGLELRMSSDDLKAIERRARNGQRIAVLLSLAGSLFVCGVLAVVLAAPEITRTRAFVFAVTAIAAAALALFAALRKS